jgi:hypothetical protein
LLNLLFFYSRFHVQVFEEKAQNYDDWVWPSTSTCFFCVMKERNNSNGVFVVLSCFQRFATSRKHDTVKMSSFRIQCRIINVDYNFVATWAFFVFGRNGKRKEVTVTIRHAFMFSVFFCGLLKIAKGSNRYLNHLSCYYAIVFVWHGKYTGSLKHGTFLLLFHNAKICQ